MFTIGTVMRFAFDGWRDLSQIGLLACDGSAHLAWQIPELYQIIGNTYGGSAASDRFNLPTLPGEYICSQGIFPPADRVGSMGAVMRFAAPIVPGASGPYGSDPYLPCNGALTDPGTYDKLFALLRFTYGGDEGVSDKFRVPTVAGMPYYYICYDRPNPLPDDGFFMGRVLLLPNQPLPATYYGGEYLLPCDGRLLPIPGYSELFSLIGSNYGGDLRTNFALPRLSAPGNLGLTHLYYIVVNGEYPPGDD